MASAIQKALANPKAQAAIKSRATSLARKKTEEAVKAVRAKFRAAVPALRKDLIESHVVPAAIGAGGAIASDLLFGRFGKNISGGARGDVIKVAAAIGIGYFGRKVVKTPYLSHASVGAATVGLYKLASRIANRAGAGTLNGLLTETHDMDLAGYQELMPVNVQYSDGSVLSGLQDGIGNLYDSNGYALQAGGDLAGTYSQGPYVPAAMIG